jgi:iron uptake system EfeUOB component EfeO/EfeM
MKKYFSLAIVAIIAVCMLPLAGCNTTQESSASVPSTASVATASTKGASTELAALSSVVSNTKSAVEAGDFAKASQAFERFEDAWKIVEDGIKAKSRNNYDAIEDTVTQVQSALKANDRPKALEALKTLETNITAVSKH